MSQDQAKCWDIHPFPLLTVSPNHKAKHLVSPNSCRFKDICFSVRAFKIPREYMISTIKWPWLDCKKRDCGAVCSVCLFRQPPAHVGISAYRTCRIDQHETAQMWFLYQILLKSSTINPKSYRQGDLWMFQVSLVYRASSRTSKPARRKKWKKQNEEINMGFLWNEQGILMDQTDSKLVSKTILF